MGDPFRIMELVGYTMDGQLVATIQNQSQTHKKLLKEEMVVVAICKNCGTQVRNNGTDWKHNEWNFSTCDSPEPEKEKNGRMRQRT